MSTNNSINASKPTRPMHPKQYYEDEYISSDAEEEGDDSENDSNDDDEPDHESLQNQVQPPTSNKHSNNYTAHSISISSSSSSSSSSSTSSTKPANKKAWTKAEDTLLASLINLYDSESSIVDWTSITSAFNANLKKNGKGKVRSESKVYNRWTKIKGGVLKKGAWIKDEDVKLKTAVDFACTTTKLANVKWSKVAQSLPGRIGKQCRERYTNHLSPLLTKTPWTAQEDTIIFTAQKMIGNVWCVVAGLEGLEGRTELGVKNRFNSNARKRWEGLGVVDAGVEEMVRRHMIEIEKEGKGGGDDDDDTENATSIKSSKPPKPPKAKKCEKLTHSIGVGDGNVEAFDSAAIDASSSSNASTSAKKRKTTSTDASTSTTIKKKFADTLTSSISTSTSTSANEHPPITITLTSSSMNSAITQIIASASQNNSINANSNSADNVTPMLLLPYFSSLNTAAQRSILKQLIDKAQDEKRKDIEDKREVARLVLIAEEENVYSLGGSGVGEAGTQTPCGFMCYSPLRQNQSTQFGDALDVNDDIDLCELFDDDVMSFVNDDNGFMVDVSVGVGCGSGGGNGGESGMETKRVIQQTRDELLSIESEDLETVTKEVVEKARLKILASLNRISSKDSDGFGSESGGGSKGKEKGTDTGN